MGTRRKFSRGGGKPKKCSPLRTKKALHMEKNASREKKKNSKNVPTWRKIAKRLKNIRI